MKRIFSTVIFFIALNSFFTAFSFSQQDTTQQKPTKLVLTDGSELIGRIVEEDTATIVFVTLGNISMKIPRGQVQSRERLFGEFVGGRYLPRDPSEARLFFAPTARALRAGEARFSAYQIFFPSLSVGIANHVTLSGGISLFPGLDNQVFYIAPKITPLQRDEVSAGLGLMYLKSTAPGVDGLGVVYLVSTYGGQKASVTGGLGWGFAGGEIADKPIVLIGGDLRITNSIKLITENWFPVNSDVSYISFGFRFFGESLAADLGLMHPAGSKITGFPFVPWVGFSYAFGSAK